jgi:S1-C subfamily serine protease
MDGDVFGEVAERIRRSTVQLRGSKNSGSGVLWGTDGKILTNAHVLREGAARVEFWNGRQTPARVLKSDRRPDVAVLQTEASGMSAAIHGNSDALRPGELVIVVGSPVEQFLNQLRLGVVIRPVATGLLVPEITPQSPAERADKRMRRVVARAA